MATRNVAVSREESKRGLETVEAARREMESAVARYAAAELAEADGSGGASPAALLDERVRRAALSAARLGLESAYRSDRSDCGAANAPGCGGCGGRMRYLRRTRRRWRRRWAGCRWPWAATRATPAAAARGRARRRRTSRVR